MLGVQNNLIGGLQISFIQYSIFSYSICKYEYSKKCDELHLLDSNVRIFPITVKVLWNIFAIYTLDSPNFIIVKRESNFSLRFSNPDQVYLAN